jgi:hypothetical protein
MCRAGAGQVNYAGTDNMLLNIFVFVLVLLALYFHYLQGFFSAGISATLVVISALVAVGYHENVVYSLLGGRYAAQAHAIALVIVFAITYIVLRQIFDRLVPGNVAFPVMVDKIGSAVCGLVAGVFGAGIVVMAASSLPFGPDIGGYTRYPVSFGMPVSVFAGQKEVAAQYDLLDAERFVDNQPDRLLIPVDDVVISLAEHVTKPGGPLGGSRSLASVHPDYLQELFGQRVGIQAAASRVASIDKSLKIEGVYVAPSLPQDDQERWVVGNYAAGVRGPETVPQPPPLPPVLKPQTGQALLVVRAMLGAGAIDTKNRMVSFGTANVRLVAGGKNYFPIGTVEGGRTLFRAAPDDYLLVPGDRAVDLVFLVDEADVLEAGEGKTYQTKAGTFLEFKRLPKEYLPETVAVGVPPPGDKVQVVRKQGGKAPPGRGSATAGTGGGGPAGGAAAAGPLTFPGTPDSFNAMPNPIPVQGDKGESDWGAWTLTEQRFSKLEVNPTRALQMISSSPGEQIDRLYVTRQQAVVQWTGTPQGGSWDWANEVGNFEIVDANNKRHKPHGVYAKVVNANGAQSIFVRYDQSRPLTSLSPSKEAKPTEVTLFWVVPNGSVIVTLEYKQERVQSFSVTAE